MQFSWIESFLAVADTGGFGSAAHHLFRSQSRVSAHIADLENELEAKLFDRTQRPVALTPEGRAFQAYARAILDNVNAGRGAVAATHELLAGNVALATYTSAGAHFVPAILRDFTERNPRVEVEIVCDAVFGLDDALRNGRAALAIRPELPALRVANARSRPLWRESIQVVLPVDHALALTAGPVPLAALPGEQLIITGQNLSRETEMTHMLGTVGLTIEPAWVTDAPAVLVGLAAAGLGIGLSNELALSALRLDGVVVRDTVPRLERTVMVCWTDESWRAPSARALLDAILAAPLPPGARAPGAAADAATDAATDAAADAGC